jgi:hypothetical protein
MLAGVAGGPSMGKRGVAESVDGYGDSHSETAESADRSSRTNALARCGE